MSWLEKLPKQSVPHSRILNPFWRDPAYRLMPNVLVILLSSVLNVPAASQEPIYVQHTNLAINGSFEDALQSGGAESDGGGWRELQLETTLPPSGTEIRRVTDTVHSGSYALAVTPTASSNSVAVEGPLQRLCPDTASCWVSAWVYGPGAAHAQPVVTWYGRQNRQLVALSHVIGASNPIPEEWRRIAMDQVPRPEGAVYGTFGLVLQRHGSEPLSTIVVDDVEIRFGVRPGIQLIVNQAGYEPRGSKPVVALANFNFEEVVDFPLPQHVEIVDSASGKTVFQAPFGAQQAIPEWDRWMIVGDASLFSATEGCFLARTYFAGQAILSPTFTIAAKVVEKKTAPLALNFTYAQRCGDAVSEAFLPGVGHPPCHLDDALAPDGTAVDATGGWHEGGDFRKTTETIAETSYALLYALTERFDLFGQVDRNGNGENDCLEEALWGIRYLERLLDAAPRLNLATGNLFPQIVGSWNWIRPHLDTDNLVGTGDERRLDGQPSLSGISQNRLIAALALLGRVWPESDAIQRARDLEQTCGTDGIGYLELWRSTQDIRYYHRLIESFNRLLESQRPDDLLPQAEAMMRFVLLVPDDPNAKPIRRALERHLLVLQTRCPAPFRVAKTLNVERELVYYQPYRDPEEWYSGNNATLIQTAIEATLATRLGWTDASEIAQAQLNWLLGFNPYGISMVEGIGVNVPRYHHRLDLSETNPRGSVPGAIIRGMVRMTPQLDRPWLDLNQESNVDFRSNEPWLYLSARWLVYLSVIPH